MSDTRLTQSDRLSGDTIEDVSGGGRRIALQMPREHEQINDELHCAMSVRCDDLIGLSAAHL
jgi:hypothetical protein